GHDASGALKAQANGGAVVATAVAGLLDAREQEDAVVGGEAEDQRKDEHRLGLLERTRGREVEEALEVTVLKYEHQGSEAGGQRQQVHQDRLHRQYHRPGHQEEDDKRGRGYKADRERQALN